MKKQAVLLGVLIAVLFLPLASFASVGVGIGTGKIQVDKLLQPGQIYPLPPLTVINTGDEPSEYNVSISYLTGQAELKPDAKWFAYEPTHVYLTANDSKLIGITLTLPVNARPGDYFAYLQAQPMKVDAAPGSTSIGVAAAAKLYFTVAPANIWQGIYYRFIYLYAKYSPWDTVILAIIAGAALILIFKKFFKIQIGIKK